MPLTLGLMKIIEKNPVAELGSLASLMEVLFLRSKHLYQPLLQKSVRIRMHQSASGEGAATAKHTGNELAW